MTNIPGSTGGAWGNNAKEVLDTLLKQKSLNRFTKRFFRSREGNVAIIFGMMAIPLMVFGGGAIDISRSNAAESEMQFACDAAALAGMRARMNPGSDYLQVAESFFENNLTTDNNGTVPTIEVVDEGLGIRISATTEITTTTLSLVNITTIPVSVTCKANYGTLLPMEVTFVLDYSGSMEGDAGGGLEKWESMRDATKQLVHQLTANHTYTEVDVALVPFSRYVRAKIKKDYIQGLSGSGKRTKCFRDRGYPHNLSDDTPDANDNQTQWPQYNDSSCDEMVDNKLKVLELTNNYTKVKNKLNGFKPSNTTNIQVGLAFGWHVLSDNAPFTQGAAYNDPDKPKVMILLSDGRHNVPGNGPSSTSVSDAEDNIEELCTKIKNEGVTIFTIAYDINDDDTRTRLRECSTGPNTETNHPYYYEPYDGQTLFSVFAGIGYQLNPDSLAITN